MNEELRPCPFCGAMPEKLRTGYMCSTLGCALQENTVSEKEWNTRPIEDELQSRIAELEKDLSNKEIEYTDLWDDALALQARIAELEADNKKAFDLVRKLRMYCIWANWDNPDTEDEFNEFDVEVCKWLSKFMESAE